MSTLTTAMVEEEVKCAHRQIERDGGSFLHRVIVHLADEVEHMKRERDTAIDERTDWMRGAEDLLHEKYRLQAELDAAHDCEDALRSEVARLRAQVAALQAEDRRVGPDEVVVPRSATEYAVRAFDWIDCPDPEHYEALRSFHDALRTSAQAHNGEESK